ncbi:hypothetical protein KO500_00100 [Cellulophaga baltica]|uniref:hypothetical protein n=1 Tax=Cellulophaga TaxID=104264 RepID=UPI001C06D850|nr:MULTISPECIES: hypothetical protein [Cellulophaga]MBU2994815.1 hypothetical protein [Cellulophaga baltica]MDO6766210.1 hypothetical protein [Cellulophaga sp. 1_MG-2023]
MKHFTLTIIGILFATFNSYAQEDVKVDKNEIEQAKEDGEEIIYERPFNAFISAGINVRIGENYNVAISPIDNTVQFEKISPLNSGVSTGLVWNPFTFPYKVFDYKGQDKDWHYEYRRNPFAIALLINVFKLSFSDEQANTTSPIDVGFGIGYRNDNLLILLTTEYTPIRQPRQYFIDGYKDKNLPLVLANSSEPVRTISSDDNSLFVTKLFPSIGLKIAYSFGKKKE